MTHKKTSGLHKTGRELAMRYVADQSEASYSPDLTLNDLQFEPMGYETLQGLGGSEKPSFELPIRSGRILESDNAELPVGNRIHIDAKPTAAWPVKAIALVPGGWLPMALTAMAPSMTSLLDQNMIGELRTALRRDGSVQRQRPLVKILDDVESAFMPLMVGMEGASRRPPTPDEFHEKTTEASKILSQILPKARIIDGLAHRIGAWEILEEGRKLQVARCDFLCRVAPNLAAPVGKTKKPRYAEWVLDQADALCLKRSDIVVSAALIAIIAIPQDNPARKIIKPRLNYDHGMAYNAVFDLFSIDLICHMFGHFPDEAIQFCTCDRQLALLWAGLAPDGFSQSTTGQGVQGALHPHPDLVPDEFVEMFKARFD